MKARYLLHFVHEHIPFRWPEFLALMLKNDCNFNLISATEHIKTRPYLIIELADGSKLENLVKSVKESYMLKHLIELWARSTISVEDLAEQVSKSSYYLSKQYSGPDQTFKVIVESFGSTINQSSKIDMIRSMLFMDDFESKPDLLNPKQIFYIHEMNERDSINGATKEYYFGRHLTRSNRKAIKQFSLKTRKFIANTSMDPMLSLVTANTAQIKPNDIVYDPFVGSGGLLIASAYLGAYVLGADIDWLLLHGKSRPSRIGQKKRQEDESVRTNFHQYDLEKHYLDVLVSDITRSPLRDNFKLDAVIADPPYGVRESSEKIGSKRERKPLKAENAVRYPAKMSYTIEELLADLFSLSAKHLKIGSRLVYYLPITKLDKNFEDFIPQHPSFELVSYSEQQLTSKNYRLMVVMEKMREPLLCDRVTVPKLVTDVSFRDSYFNKID